MTLFQIQEGEEGKKMPISTIVIINKKWNDLIQNSRRGGG